MTADVEAVGAETAGAAAGVFATSGAGCFRAKKKIAANRIKTAETETRVSVVKIGLAGCFRRDEREVTLAAGAEGSAAMVTACSGGSDVSGVVVRTLSGGTMSVGTLLRGMRVRVSLRRFGFCGTGIGGAWLGETGPGGAGLGGARLG